MAIITVPLLVTTILVVRHIRKRNRARRALASEDEIVEELDTSVVSATIVLSALSPTVLEGILEELPPDMARAIVLMMPELPPVANTVARKEQARWLAHLAVEGISWPEVPSLERRKLAAATVKMVLEDTP